MPTSDCRAKQYLKQYIGHRLVSVINCCFGIDDKSYFFLEDYMYVSLAVWENTVKKGVCWVFTYVYHFVIIYSFHYLF